MINAAATVKVSLLWMRSIVLLFVPRDQVLACDIKLAICWREMIKNGCWCFVSTADPFVFICCLQQQNINLFIMVLSEANTFVFMVSVFGLNEAFVRVEKIIWVNWITFMLGDQIWAKQEKKQQLSSVYANILQKIMFCYVMCIHTQVFNIFNLHVIQLSWVWTLNMQAEGR